MSVHSQSMLENMTMEELLKEAATHNDGEAAVYLAKKLEPLLNGIPPLAEMESYLEELLEKGDEMADKL